MLKKQTEAGGGGEGRGAQREPRLLLVIGVVTVIASGSNTWCGLSMDRRLSAFGKRGDGNVALAPTQRRSNA